MKWSSQVVFETDLPRGAANAFSVYMSVHAASVIVFLRHLRRSVILYNSSVCCVISDTLT